MEITANNLIDTPTKILSKDALNMSVERAPLPDVSEVLAIAKTIKDLEGRFHTYYERFESSEFLTTNELIIQLKVFTEPLKLNIVDSDSLIGIYRPFANFISFIITNYENAEKMGIEFTEEDVYSASSVAISEMINHYRKGEVDEITLDRFFKFVVNIAKKFRQSIEFVKQVAA